MTTTTTHTQDQQHAAADQPTRIFAQWGLPHTVTPRFGARLIQEHHRLHFLSDRASLVGEWEEEAIDQLEAAFPAIIKELESKLLIGELDARRQQRITVHHSGFTCEADTLWQPRLCLRGDLPCDGRGRQSETPLYVACTGLIGVSTRGGS